MHELSKHVEALVGAISDPEAKRAASALLEALVRSGIRVGDVVRLKSGGPVMTVVSVLGTTGHRCSWFHDQEVRMDFFPPEALERLSGENTFVRRRLPYYFAFLPDPRAPGEERRVLAVVEENFWATHEHLDPNLQGVVLTMLPGWPIFLREVEASTFTWDTEQCSVDELQRLLEAAGFRYNNLLEVRCLEGSIWSADSEASEDSDDDLRAL